MIGELGHNTLSWLTLFLAQIVLESCHINYMSNHGFNKCVNYQNVLQVVKMTVNTPNIDIVTHIYK